jgi:hypothetical protein
MFFFSLLSVIRFDYSKTGEKCPYFLISALKAVPGVPGKYRCSSVSVRRGSLLSAAGPLVTGCC